MFPLGHVLLPGEVLPLQVFELRYHAMVRDCLEVQPPELGVVMIERGSEVGGGDQRATVGTMARIAQLRQLPNGRLALAVVGMRRIRIERWLDDDPYPLADVVDWPDEDDDRDDRVGGLEHRLGECRAKVRRVAALALEVGHPAAPEQELAASPVAASYQLAASAPLGPADRHRLLCAPGPAARLTELSAALDDLEAMLRFQIGSPEP